MNQAEESWDNRDFGAVRNILAYKPLGELIQGKEGQSKKKQIFHWATANSLTTAAHRSQRVG
jgi:hypothetical protein